MQDLDQIRSASEDLSAEDETNSELVHKTKDFIKAQIGFWEKVSQDFLNSEIELLHAEKVLEVSKETSKDIDYLVACVRFI